MSECFGIMSIPPSASIVSWVPTANVVGGINALTCPTSIEHSASPYVVHGQRSVGGSPA